jgi:hypothetical protein
MLVLDAVRKQDKLYFIADCFAALLVYDFTNGKTEICGRFDNYKFLEDSVCSKLHLHGNHIYCAPGRGNTFYDYDIETNTLIKLNTNSKYDNIEMHDFTWFHQAYEVDNKIVFVGFICRDIVVIDPSDNTFTVLDLRDPEEIAANKILRQSVQGVVDGSRITFPEVGRALMTTYDVKENKVIKKQLDESLNPLGIFEMKGKRYIFCFDGMKILSEDLKTRIDIPDDCGNIPPNRAVCKVFVCGDRCMIVPFRGKKVLQLSDGDTKAKSVCDVSDLYKERTFMAAGWLDEATIWASSLNGADTTLININDFSRSSLHIPNPDNIEDFIRFDDIEGTMIMESVCGHQLSDYLSFLSKV